MKMMSHYARFEFEPSAYSQQYEYNHTVLEDVNTVQQWKQIIETLKDEIEFQNQRRHHYYNQHRQTESSLKEKDEVYLLRRNIKTKRSSNKLNYKKLELFKIKNKINNVTYKLVLLKRMKIFDIFHVFLLESISERLQRN